MLIVFSASALLDGSFYLLFYAHEMLYTFALDVFIEFAFFHFFIVFIFSLVCSSSPIIILEKPWPTFFDIFPTAAAQQIM